MAINPLNFLIEISVSNNNTLEQIQHALGYSKVGDCFHSEDWVQLNNAPNLETIKEVATKLIPDYRTQYTKLGEPKTAEAWYAALYPPVRQR